MSQAAGRAVTTLIADYKVAAQPVVFIEQDVDTPIDGSRRSRWWAAYDSSGSVYLPLILVDSGNQITNGSEDYLPVYRNMVENALARPPGAAIFAVINRINDDLQFAVDVTNLSGVTLSAANRARVYAFAYEEGADSGLTGNYLLKSSSISVSPDLEPGAKASFNLEIQGVEVDNWDSLQFVVFIEYRPEGALKYEMLQAGFLTEQIDSHPNLSPVMMLLL